MHAPADAHTSALCPAEHAHTLDAFPRPYAHGDTRNLRGDERVEKRTEGRKESRDEGRGGLEIYNDQVKEELRNDMNRGGGVKR